MNYEAIYETKKILITSYREKFAFASIDKINISNTKIYFITQIYFE